MERAVHEWEVADGNRRQAGGAGRRWRRQCGGGASAGVRIGGLRLYGTEDDPTLRAQTGGDEHMHEYAAAPGFDDSFGGNGGQTADDWEQHAASDQQPGDSPHSRAMTIVGSWPIDMGRRHLLSGQNRRAATWIVVLARAEPGRADGAVAAPVRQGCPAMRTGSLGRNGWGRRVGLEQLCVTARRLSRRRKQERDAKGARGDRWRRGRTRRRARRRTARAAAAGEAAGDEQGGARQG